MFARISDVLLRCRPLWFMGSMRELFQGNFFLKEQVADPAIVRGPDPGRLSREGFIFRARFGRELLLEFDEGGLETGIAGSQDLDGQNAGVAGAIDGHGGHRNTGRHLDDRQEGVKAIKGFSEDGDADDGEGGERGGDARQMGGAAGAGDNHAQTAADGGLDIFFQAVRIAVGGNNARFAANAEFGQGIGGGFHDGPVRIAAH